MAVGERIDGLLRLFRRDPWQELIRQAVPALTATQQAVAYGLAAQIVDVFSLLQRDGLAGEASL